MRCDGVIPQYQTEGTPQNARAIREWLGDAKLDIIAEGETDPLTARETVQPWADAGCTWWLESRWEMPHNSAERMTQVRERLIAGPP